MQDVQNVHWQVSQPFADVFLVGLNTVLLLLLLFLCCSWWW
jgi:hypothetical protein